MNSWIIADLEHNSGAGLTGNLGALGGVKNWMTFRVDCCDIGDMDVGDELDINDALGQQVETIAQEDLQV